MPRTNHRSGPRITIGLPVRNGEPYLAAAIESILGQTMGDLSLVVSDNASTDGTPDIVAEAAAADRRVRALRNTVDLGANPNYNRLLAHARGPYFKWAAADDIVAPDYLDGVLRLLDRRPDAVLGHSRMRLIDRTGAPLRPVTGGYVDVDGIVETAPEGAAFVDGVADPRPERRLWAVIAHTGYAGHIFGVIRTDTLLATPRLGSLYGADKLLLARLALQGRFVTLDADLFHRRCHPGTSTRQTDRRAKAAWSEPGRPAAWYPTAMLSGYAAAVHDHTSTAADRIRCGVPVVAGAFRPGKWRQLLEPGPWNYLGLGAGSAPTTTSAAPHTAAA